MSNTNETKQAAADRRDNSGPAAATVPLAPPTEAELEAIRYRGAPLLRAGPPAAANHNPISPIKPDGNNKRPPAGSKAEAENLTSEEIINKAPETPPVP